MGKPLMVAELVPAPVPTKVAPVAAFLICSAYQYAPETADQENVTEVPETVAPAEGDNSVALPGPDEPLVKVL